MKHRLSTVIKGLLANRRFRLAAFYAVLLFAVSNAITYLAYHDKTYPNTTVAGYSIGSVHKDSLEKRFRELALLPNDVRLETGSDSAKLPVSKLGVKPDYQSMRDEAMAARSWLPVANLLSSQTVMVALDIQYPAVQAALAPTLAGFQRPPADARIVRADSSFAVESEKAGREIDDKATQQRLITALRNGRAGVKVATKPVGAKIKAADLQSELSKLNSQAKTTISLSYEGKRRQFNATDIAGWYTPDKASMALADSAILASVAKVGADFGIGVQNINAAGAAVKTAVQNQKALDFALVATPKAVKTYTYCTAVRGVDGSLLAEMNTKLQSTFNDNRGWNIGGLVQFQPGTSGCDMTVWLAAADQMSSFGAICDAEWSCAVSPNVIINYDRWTGASAAWNSQGGSLQDYRSMVINHEVGHWLGFYHSYCGGPGQAAPVMQQQSIDLQGCTFNPWPNAAEQASLKARLGI